MPRLRVRNHETVVAAPVPPRVVPAFAGLLLARQSRRDTVCAPIAIPTSVRGRTRNCVPRQSPLKTAVVAKMIMISRNIRCAPVGSIVR
jgi:hypothetical protein